MFKDTFILLLLCALVSNTVGEPEMPRNNQQGLASLFISSRITQNDPMQSLACFSDYIEESNGISEKYGNDYNDCQVKSAAEREEINAGALRERREIEISAEAVCTRMRACNANNNPLDMFECHAQLGSKNTKSSYTISGNASEYAAILQERYRLVEFNHDQCCAAAERVYVQRSAKNYNQLQACLDLPRPPNTTTTLLPSTSSTAIPSITISSPSPATTTSTSAPTTRTSTPEPTKTTPPPTTTQPPLTTTSTQPPTTTSTTTTTPTTTTPTKTPSPTTTTPSPSPTTTPSPSPTTTSTLLPTTTSTLLPTTTSTNPPTTTTPPPTTTTATPAPPQTTLPTSIGTPSPTESETPPATESPIPSTLELSAETTLPPQTLQEPLVKLLNLLN